jgi:hypothetical protein
MATELETKWKDMHVDLSKLNASFQEYFTRKGFTVNTGKAGEEHVILVKPRSQHKIVERIQVTITGNSDDLSVRFLASSRSRGFMIFGTLTALLGGGLFASKGLKSDETIEKLEKDFREYVSEKVWELRNTA